MQEEKNETMPILLAWTIRVLVLLLTIFSVVAMIVASGQIKQMKPLVGEYSVVLKAKKAFTHATNPYVPDVEELDDKEVKALSEEEKKQIQNKINAFYNEFVVTGELKGEDLELALEVWLQTLVDDYQPIAYAYRGFLWGWIISDLLAFFGASAVFILSDWMGGGKKLNYIWGFCCFAVTVLEMFLFSFVMIFNLQKAAIKI